MKLKKDILLYTTEEFSQLTDEELEALVEVYWPVTRPSKIQINIAKNVAVMKAAGIDLKKIAAVRPAKLVAYENKFGKEIGKLVYDEEQRISRDKGSDKTH